MCKLLAMYFILLIGKISLFTYVNAVKLLKIIMLIAYDDMYVFVYKHMQCFLLVTLLSVDGNSLYSNNYLQLPSNAIVNVTYTG